MKNQPITSAFVGTNGTTLATTQRYTAKVVTSEKGYSFARDVRDGYGMVNTNGDVFVVGDFEIDTIITFGKLDVDPARTGKYRVEGAGLTEEGMVLADGQSVGAMILRASEQGKNLYHRRAKPIDDADLAKAVENVPFDLLVNTLVQKRGVEDDSIQSVAEDGLAQHYPNLLPFNVSPVLDDTVDEEAEGVSIASHVERLRATGMGGQADALGTEYRRFCKFRKGLRLMNDNNRLHLEAVVPYTHLSELLVCAPVWFVEPVSEGALPNNSGKDDPRPDAAVEFFCDCVGTNEFANLYQLYNRRTRKFDALKDTRDIVPPTALGMIETAKAEQVFDWLVVMTPYHDLASKDWADPEWVRSVDPYLFGFIEGVPYAFLLYRWSGTGLFPLVPDMIADTMNHLGINIGTLEELTRASSYPYWYNPTKKAITDTCEKWADIVKTAKDALRAYEEGKLFTFLRGEKPELDSSEGATE